MVSIHRRVIWMMQLIGYQLLKQRHTLKQNVITSLLWYVHQHNNQTVNGVLWLKTSTSNSFLMLLQAIHPNIQSSENVALIFGKSLTVDESVYLW